MASRDRDIGRKYDSGSAKRKKAEKRKELEGQLRNLLTKFLKSETGKNVSNTETPKKIVTCGTLGLYSASLESPEAPNHPTLADPSSSIPKYVSVTSQLQLETIPVPVPGSPLSRDVSSTPSCSDPEIEETFKSESEENDETKDILSDSYLWPNHLTQSERTRIIEKGPAFATDKVFPKNESGRHFSSIYYTRHLSNGEQQKRRWLIYSESNDSLLCVSSIL
jgi:hypothetical protein